MRQDPPSRRDRRVSSIASSPAAASAAALRVGWASTRAAIGSLAATPGGSLSRSSRLPPRSLAASRKLDEGLEPDPVGDRDPAGGGVFSWPGRPGVQQLMGLDLAGGRSDSGHFGRSWSHQPCWRVPVVALRSRREGQRCSSTGRAIQAVLARGGWPQLGQRWTR